MSMIPLAELVQQAQFAHFKIQERLRCYNTQDERDQILAIAAKAAPDLHFILRAHSHLEPDNLDLVPLVEIGERR